MEPAPTEVWTIGRVLRWTQQRFAERGISTPRLDAELLLAFTLGRSRVALYTHFDEPLKKDELSRYRDFIKRRLAGAPVAYLIGEKEFFGLPFRVSPAVLIPRPETELLVEAVLEHLPKTAAPRAVDLEVETQTPAEPGVELSVTYDEWVENDTPTGEADAEVVSAVLEKPASTVAAECRAAPIATVVDVGTGSGAVALSIRHRRPDVRVIAIDCQKDALEVAMDNAQRLGLPLEFLHGDLLAPLPPTERQRIDIIAANLPYIPAAEIEKLAPEVRSEPRTALDGGTDGLELIRRLIKESKAFLRPGGVLLLEVGDGQAAAVEKLLTTAGLCDVKSTCDLAQIPRVVFGRMPDA